MAKPTRIRFLVLAWVGTGAACAYLTRVALAAANTTIQSELELTDLQMGDVLAAFFVGYLIFQIPGGWLGVRFGRRATLAGLAACGSVATVWTAMADGMPGLRYSRIILGLAQAGMVPCTASVLKDWISEKNRGMASAIVTSSMSVGAVVASGLTAILLPVASWRIVLAAYAAVGLLWAIGFYVWFRNRPEEHPQVNTEELAIIRSKAVAKNGVSSPAIKADQSTDDPQATENASEEINQTAFNPPLKPTAMQITLILLSSLNMWAICGQAFSRAFGYLFFITWFPAWLERGRGAEVTNAGLLSMIPLAAFVTGCLSGGLLIDWVLKKTNSKWLSRCGLSAAVLALSALCTVLATVATGPVSAAIVIGLGAFFSGLGAPAMWAATLDVGGTLTALIFGIMNMAGVSAGVVCPKIVGLMFDWIDRTGGDWNLVLYLFASVYLVGTVCWVIINPNRTIVSEADSIQPAADGA